MNLGLNRLCRAALVQYGDGLGGGIPNVILFQFNPETITRTIEIPPRPTGAALREVNQAGDVPVERISFVAHFTTQEEAARTSLVAIAAGIGPQLAALEKLIVPAGPIAGLIAQGVDKIKDAISSSDSEGTQKIPREAYPRILFIWGATRVLPVTIDSISITEKQYDDRLNPTLAEVSISLTAIVPDPCSDDRIAKGAYLYSAGARDALAVLKPAEKAGFEILDLIHF